MRKQLNLSLKGATIKEFNTTAICVPSKHYMVDPTDKAAEIRRLVDAGKYFTMNRARQYGKTTTLTAPGAEGQDIDKYADAETFAVLDGTKSWELPVYIVQNDSGKR